MLTSFLQPEVMLLWWILKDPQWILLLLPQKQARLCLPIINYHHLIGSLFCVMKISNPLGSVYIKKLYF